MPQKYIDGLYVLSVLNSRKENVLLLHTMNSEASDPKQISLKKTEALCHNRTGHGHRLAIQCTMKSLIYGILISSAGERTKCKTCTKIKATMKPHLRNMTGGGPNITVHTDVCRPINVKILGGKRYFVTFALVSHRRAVFKLIKHQNEVPDHSQNMISWADRNSVTIVKKVHSDKVQECHILKEG